MFEIILKLIAVPFCIIFTRMQWIYHNYLIFLFGPEWWQYKTTQQTQSQYSVTSLCMRLKLSANCPLEYSVDSHRELYAATGVNVFFSFFFAISLYQNTFDIFTSFSRQSKCENTIKQTDWSEDKKKLRNISVIVCISDDGSTERRMAKGNFNKIKLDFSFKLVWRPYFTTEWIIALL